MSAFRTLDDAGSLQGKRVLLRVDLNVPMDNGRVTDATRIERVVPTIREIAGKGAKVVLLAHFGRPKGKREAKDSLEPVVPALSKALGQPVAFASDCIGDPAAQAVAAMKDGDVLLLENTRYHAGEEKNEAGFADALAANGDVYVNEAFSAAHRAHASTEGLPTACRPMPAARCRPSSTPSPRAWNRPSARSSPSSAAPRCRPRSTSSKTSSPRSTCW